MIRQFLALHERLPGKLSVAGEFIKFESDDPNGPNFLIPVQTALVRDIGKNSVQFLISQAGESGPTCVVQNIEVIKLLAQHQNPSSIKLLPDVNQRKLKRIGLILLPLFFFGGTLFFLPLVLSRLHSVTLDQILPIEQEVKLRSYFKSMVDHNDAPKDLSQLGKDLKLTENEGYLEQMVSMLAQNSPPLQRYQVDVALISSKEVNAFALPGGIVIVNQGLITKAESSEEIMGVLAHELAHLELRHSLRGLINASSRIAAGIGLALILPTDFVSLVFQGYGLFQLSFSRAQEAAADQKAFEYLHHLKISPEGLIQFFERLGKSTEAKDLLPNPSAEKIDKAISFLSTHPLSSERVDLLRQKYLENFYEPTGRAPVAITRFREGGK